MDRHLHQNSHWEVKQCTVSILWSAVPMEDRPSALALAHASESHMHASTVYYTQKFCSEIEGLSVSSAKVKLSIRREDFERFLDVIVAHERFLQI